jgi:hypothetical protein
MAFRIKDIKEEIHSFNVISLGRTGIAVAGTVDARVAATALDVPGAGTPRGEVAGVEVTDAGVPSAKISMPHLLPVYRYPSRIQDSWQYALVALIAPVSTWTICAGSETSTALTAIGPPVA